MHHWAGTKYKSGFQRHNESDGVSNHQPYDCLLISLFRHTSKKTSKLCITGICEVNSPLTGEFRAQMAVTREMVPFDDVIINFESRTGMLFIHFLPQKMATTNQIIHSAFSLLKKIQYQLIFIAFRPMASHKRNSTLILIMMVWLIGVSIISTHWGRDKMAVIFQATDFQIQFLKWKYMNFD